MSGGTTALKSKSCTDMVNFYSEVWEARESKADRFNDNSAAFNETQRSLRHRSGIKFGSLRTTVVGIQPGAEAFERKNKAFRRKLLGTTRVDENNMCECERNEAAESLRACRETSWMKRER